MRVFRGVPVKERGTGSRVTPNSYQLAEPRKLGVWIPLASYSHGGRPSEVTVFDVHGLCVCECMLQIQSAYRTGMPRRSTVLRLPVITCVVELLRARRQDVADQNAYLDLALFDDAFELWRPGA